MYKIKCNKILRKIIIYSIKYLLERSGGAPMGLQGLNEVKYIFINIALQAEQQCVNSITVSIYK